MGKNGQQTNRGEQPIRVLIADEVQVVRRGVRQEIEQHPDLELVGEAANGYDALRMAQQLCPDVIVMDVYLPGLSGIQVMRRLNSSSPGVKLPCNDSPAVLIFTNYDDRQYVWSSLAAGAKGYLLKNEVLPKVMIGIHRVANGEAVLSESVQTMLVELIPKITQELSAAEMSVLRLLARGLSNEEIAKALKIKEGTVKVHLNNTYRKVPLIRTRAEAIAWAWINRIVAE